MANSSSKFLEANSTNRVPPAAQLISMVTEVKDGQKVDMTL